MRNEEKMYTMLTFEIVNWILVESEMIHENYVKKTVLHVAFTPLGSIIFSG